MRMATETIDIELSKTKPRPLILISAFTPFSAQASPIRNERSNPALTLWVSATSPVVPESRRVQRHDPGNGAIQPNFRLFRGEQCPTGGPIEELPRYLRIDEGAHARSRT